MKKVFSKLMFVGVLFFLLGSTTVSAQKKGHGKQMKCPQKQECCMMKGLDLSEDQQVKIKEIKVESQKNCKPWRDELRELKAHQQTLMTADKPNMSAIDKNIEKMSSLMLNMAKNKARTMQEVRSLLTDEQRMKFDAKHCNRSGKCRQNTKGNMQKCNKPCPNGRR